MNQPVLLPGAGTFFSRVEHPNHTIGVLCLHGLNASPDEVRWLAESLAEAGYTVYAPRIAGHGNDPRAMRRSRWQDWYLSALDAYQVLRAQCSQVIVCGLSMGGLLALLLGAWQKADGVVVMGAPLQMKETPSVRYIQWLKFLRPYFDSTDTSDFVDRLRAEQARRGELVRGRVRYNLWTAQSVQELKELIRAVNPVLSEIRAPVLAIYSESDQTVSLESHTRLLAGLRDAPTESHIFQQSGHILTQDIDRDAVMARVGAFVAALTPPEPPLARQADSPSR